MSRKDIIKKSLGITEYPWSSDDELEEVVPAETSSRRTADSRHSVADTSGTSGLTPQASQHQQPHQSALRRNQDRADRELFWSLINSPHRGVVSTVPLSNRQRSTEFPSYLSRVSHTPVAELRERGDRSTTGDIRSRIIAFRRLSRNVGSLGHGRCVSGLVPISRVNPGVVVPSEATSSIRINRTVPHRRYYRSTPSASCSSRTNVPSSPHISRPRREHETSSSRAPVQLLDHDETPLPAISRQNTNISDEGNPEPEETFEGEGEVASAETSGETLSLEEGAASQAGAEGAGPGAQLPAPQDPADGRFTTEFHRTKTDLNLSSVSQTAEAEAPPQQSTSHGVKRKRRDSDESTEPFTVQEFNQNLLRLLECPVCLEWMEPPMSQCRRGHLVCGRCRERLNCCPVCRTAFSSVRNRAMEGVAEMLRYPCRHGCGREVRLRRRAPHEASCAARNYLCPAPLCADSQPLPRAKLHQHFQSKHLPMIKIGRRHKFSMKVNLEQHDNWLIFAMDEYFHLRIDVDIRTWGVIVYVSYIGPKCDAKNYTYSVTVDGQHNSRKISYARSTHSDLESSSLNVTRQDCFHLTLDQALNFIRFKNRHCDADKFLDFNVEIAKVEPTVPRDESDS